MLLGLLQPCRWGGSGCGQHWGDKSKSEVAGALKVGDGISKENGRSKGVCSLLN